MVNVDLLDTKKFEKYLKGTTTLGLVCKDGVVLASDTRSTMGFFIADKDARKLYNIDDKIVMSTAGLVGDNQALVRIMRAQASLYKLQGKPMTVKSASTLLANILHSSRVYPFVAQLIVGGVDTEGRIYELDPVGGMSEKKAAATGSGSPTAYGVLETEYKEEMDLEDGVKLAVKAVNTALQRDVATGNNVDVMKVTDKGYERLTREEIDAIVKEISK